MAAESKVMGRTNPPGKAASAGAVLAAIVLLLLACACSRSANPDISDPKAVADAFVRAVVAGADDQVLALSSNRITASDASALRTAWTKSDQRSRATSVDLELAGTLPDSVVYVLAWLETEAGADGRAVNEESHGIELQRRTERWSVISAW